MREEFALLLQDARRRRFLCKPLLSGNREESLYIRAVNSTFTEDYVVQHSSLEFHVIRLIS